MQGLDEGFAFGRCLSKTVSGPAALRSNTRRLLILDCLSLAVVAVGMLWQQKTTLAAEQRASFDRLVRSKAMTLDVS